MSPDRTAAMGAGRRRRPTPGHTLLVLLALVAMGGHVSVIQIAAWTGMIISRTPEQGFTHAVASTLSGEQPCTVCNAVKHLQATQDPAADGTAPATPQPDATVIKKMAKQPMAIDEAAADALAASVHALRPTWPGPAPRLSSHMPAPPVPPPRALAG